MLKNVSRILALVVAVVAASVVRAAVEIGSESGAGAINCPGTINVTSDGVYCNGELLSQSAGSSSTTETSSAQGGFVAAAILGALVAAFV